ncbi:MAG: undecaprenyl pyrophosphate synthase [Candidatus Parcubacteria bacterium]
MTKTTIQCIGFIMDGNRRWAKEQGLPTLVGHKQGGEVFLSSLEWVREAGIPHAVYYAFSTENWKRSEAEVSYLMELFQEYLADIAEKMNREESQLRVRVIGKREDFSPEIQSQIAALERHNDAAIEPITTIWIALSYGGRAELVAVFNKAVMRGELVTEEVVSSLLWTAGMPDPDIIVRTGGEQRLSNFLPWQSVYSELLFLDSYWPALTKDDFIGILKEYESRERRTGA